MKRTVLFLALVSSACTSSKAASPVEAVATSKPCSCDDQVLDAKAVCAAKTNKAEEDLAACKAQLSKCSLAVPAAKAAKAKK